MTAVYGTDHSSAATALGVGSVRIDAKWKDIEPTEGTRDWSTVCDQFMRARNDGMEVLVSIGGDHSHDQYDIHEANAGYPDWIDNPQVYATWQDAWWWYVHDAVTEFADSGVAIGIWNEPDSTSWNYSPFDFSDTPENYGYLVSIADSARADANSGAVLAMPETSDSARYGSGGTGLFNTFMYWINYYGAIQSQDVITVHYYANNNMGLWDYVSGVAYTTGSRPIWVTELGGDNTQATLGGLVSTFLTSGLPWYKIFPYVLHSGDDGNLSLCDHNWNCFSYDGYNEYQGLIETRVCE